MADEISFTIDEANKAQKALREAAGLAPARFPIPAVVGMLSDEIEALRTSGKTDADIANIIETASGKPIGASAISEHYVAPDKRHSGGA